MRHATLETGARDSAKTGEGGWASWTAQALFAWTRTHDEPGKSGTFGYIAAGLLCADVSFTYRALARFWAVGAKASHGNNRLLDACFRVFARCAKRKFSTLSLCSAVENGSFSRLARPLQHQRTLINWGDANSQQAKEGGSVEECDAAKPRLEKHSAGKI